MRNDIIYQTQFGDTFYRKLPKLAAYKYACALKKKYQVLPSTIFQADGSITVKADGITDLTFKQR